MAYEFHYTPMGTGVISGKEVLEQTEDAINDLGNTAISGVQEALDKAEQALTNSENAVDDAQTALNTANNAEGVAIQAQTDVGNLSGTVTNIGNRVTTAEGNISNLQGRMTTAEGNITNLQGRMTTAETNIGNLQTAVSTAQATANSAQQTAMTARQQSYVFRYSGTAITDNSTIAYSTIDNTDNIKSGDKILDVDGKLFEITAVDTTNQTVTVGSALVDLALDANVVHTSGSETVGGQKTFSDTATFASVNVEDIRWKSLVNQTVDLNDCYVPRAGAISGYYTTDISSGANISNKATNTAFTMLSLTTRRVSASDYQVRQVFYGSGAKYIRTCSNGTWTAWVNETDKYVTIDTVQTITSAKTFSADAILYNSDNSANTPSLNLRTAKFVKGDTSNTDDINVNFLDANNQIIASVRATKNTGGTQYLTFQTNTTDNNDLNITSIIHYYISKNGNCYFTPYIDNQIILGTGVRKWKDVETYQINSLTPSSLSLPDFASRVDITGYISNLSGSTNNYTPPVNGWLYVGSNDASYLALFDTGSGGCGIRFSDGVVGEKYACIPCQAKRTLGIKITCTNLAHAYFVPCLGNI